MTKKSEIKRDLANLNLIVTCYGDNNLVASLQYCELNADCYYKETITIERQLRNLIFADMKNGSERGLKYAKHLISDLEFVLKQKKR